MTPRPNISQNSFHQLKVFLWLYRYHYRAFYLNDFGFQVSMQPNILTVEVLSLQRPFLHVAVVCVVHDDDYLILVWLVLFDARVSDPMILTP